MNLLPLVDSLTRADARDERLEAEIDAVFRRIEGAPEQESIAALTEISILLRRRSHAMVLLAEMRWRERLKATAAGAAG